MKMPVSQSVTPKFLRNPAAAQFLGIGGSTLEKLRCSGDGPRFSKLGKIVVYSRSDLESWAEARAVASTSESDHLRSVARVKPRGRPPGRGTGPAAR
ncbi:MAG: helix-turn-helix domain-containing protein [Magnetococcales bacterium]|nr:helix-turn-helix domain-containing protein [Magnetococcales bacterium]